MPNCWPKTLGSGRQGRIPRRQHLLGAQDARWSHLQANAKQSSIGLLIDDAMRAIERDNESLKSVLPRTTPARA